MNINGNQYIPRILIVDSNVDYDNDYAKIKQTLNDLLNLFINNGVLKEYSLKITNELPEQIENNEIDLLICSGKFKNDLFNRGYINISKMIIVFCANISFHKNDPNVLSHPEIIKVETNVNIVCNLITEYFENLIQNLKTCNYFNNYE